MRPLTPRPLLFDHMPRCGGTAFTGWLRGHYASARTLGLEGLGNAERIAGFAALDEQHRHAVELVVGHGARDVIGLVRPDMMRITCFRDPVARVLSFHRYVLQEPTHVHHPFVNAESLGLGAFARDPRVPGARNYYTFQLSRIPREEIARDPHAAVDAAVEFLSREFDIAGTVDRFENFARAVRRAACLYVRDGEARWPAVPRALLDRARLLPAPEVGVVNGAPKRDRSPTADEIEEVRSLNSADILFFERIHALEGSLLPAGRCLVV